MPTNQKINRLMFQYTIQYFKVGFSLHFLLHSHTLVLLVISSYYLLEYRLNIYMVGRRIYFFTIFKWHKWCEMQGTKWKLSLNKTGVTVENVSIIFPITLLRWCSQAYQLYMESLLSEQQDWYWPGVADQIRSLSGKGLTWADQFDFN